jgi:hypothetical protein
MSPIIHAACRAGVLGAVLVLPAGLSAQGPTCPVRQPAGAETRIGSDQANLPVDRLADLLALAPGVASLGTGELNVRAAGRNATTAYLDGIPVTPGRRSLGPPLLGGSYLGASGSGIAIGTNAFAEIRLTPGVSAAEFGNGRGGAIQVRTSGDCPSTVPVQPLALRGSYATDAMFGTGHGLGFNRLTLNGDLATGRWTGGVAAVLEGEKTARLGLEQNDSPVYGSNGVDTTVAVTSGGATRQVDVLRFSPSPGIRIPSSALSSYTLLGRVGYRLGERHRVEVVAAGSQRQARRFDYENLYNPPQLGAERAWSQLVTGSWFGILHRSGDLALDAEAHLSWQRDQSTRGPLTSSAELDSRDPFGGYLVSPLGFRWDADNFPVDDELIRNFRTNTGRRSPYDLSNTTQYALVDEFRNNAYGLAGFSESGGPVGLLTLAREDRLVGKLVARLASGPHQGRVGVEGTQYREEYYSAQLTSQVGADAYLGSPRQLAVFADYDVKFSEVAVEAGLRYDWFRSDASRPEFPRISSAPGFDPAHPAAGFVDDASHGRLNPSLRVTARLSNAVSGWMAAATRSQVPDFGSVYQGANTDASVTALNQVYGSDLGFERTTTVEVGSRAAFGEHTDLEGALWARRDDDLAQIDILSEYDSLTQADVSIHRWTNSGYATAKGLELRLTRRFGRLGRAWVNYSYADATRDIGNVVLGANGLPSASIRPHTLALVVMLETGAEEKALGGVFSRTGVYATARVASGTGFTHCTVPSTLDIGVVSDAVCAHTFKGEYEEDRLPAFSQVDLKLTRGVPIGRTTLTLFADLRNLFNASSTVRVFVLSGKTHSSVAENTARAADLGSLGAEGLANGVLLPDGSLDLSFGRGACGGWVTAAGAGASPNCIYLIGAEQRFGNGDQVYTPAEQARASEAYYMVRNGLQNFTAPGRRVRLGAEVRF